MAAVNGYCRYPNFYLCVIIRRIFFIVIEVALNRLWMTFFVLYPVETFLLNGEREDVCAVLSLEILRICSVRAMGLRSMQMTSFFA